MSESLLWIEGLTAIIALLYYKSVKQQYWIYFVYYLLMIFLFEAFGKWGKHYVDFSKPKYYNYIVIPFQFIFFYWLYAKKSFEDNKLFWIIISLYLISFIPSELFFKESKIFFSFNYTFGCLLLMFLVIKEYYKQISSSEIINFSRNKMFYINLGVTLFYIGTLPFITFYSLLREQKEIWNVYLYYFLISDIVMYLLFSASFIWGKQNS